jgi:hypothetical protein
MGGVLFGGAPPSLWLTLTGGGIVICQFPLDKFASEAYNSCMSVQSFM